MPLLGDFEVPLLHVPALFGVERVGDAPQDEDVQLDALFPLRLLPLLFLLNDVKKPNQTLFRLQIYFQSCKTEALSLLWVVLETDRSRLVW